MSEPKIPGGYILLARKIIESEIWKKPPLYLKVWIWLLSQAQHQEYKGLKRGSYKTCLQDMIDAMTYKIGYRTVKPSKKEIWGIIDWLRNPCEGNNEGTAKVTMMVTTKVTHGFVYDVVNYGFYQDAKNYEGNNEGNNEGTAKVTTKRKVGEQYKQECNKNDKKYNNKDIIFSPESWEYKLASGLQKMILKNNPTAKTPDDLQKWSKGFDMILRIDKRDINEIPDVLMFSQQDKFWRINILSPDSFRKHYDKLKMLWEEWVEKTLSEADRAKR